jgi:hypothetical protein
MKGISWTLQYGGDPGGTPCYGGDPVGHSIMADIQVGHPKIALIQGETVWYTVLEAQAELSIGKGPDGTLQNCEGPGGRVIITGTEVESSNTVQVQVGHFNMAEDQLGCFMAEN